MQSYTSALRASIQKLAVCLFCMTVGCCWANTLRGLTGCVMYSHITQLVLQSLGADECVDYHKDKFEEVYAHDPFDVIVDLIGG